MLFWTDGLCPATVRFIEHPIILNIPSVFWPLLLWPSRCLSCSSDAQSEPWGPLCWVLAFLTASYQHLLWTPIHQGPRPLRPGVAFPTTSRLPPTPSGASPWNGIFGRVEGQNITTWIHTHTCTHLHAHIRMYIRSHIQTYTYTYTHTHKYIYIHTHMQIYILINTNMHIETHLHIPTQTYIRLHIRTHTRTHIYKVK